MPKKPDYYSKKAKREGLKSRAAYKLEQIQRKYRLIQKGDIVIDLCGCPGGWAQIAKRETGKTGLVVLVDLKKVQIKNVLSIVADITKEEIYTEILNSLNEIKQNVRCVDGVLADCSPNVSGSWTTDHFRQIWLAENALEISKKLSAKYFICKVFQGEGLDDFITEVRKVFTRVRRYKPDASRKASAEIYLIAFSPKNNLNQNTIQTKGYIEQ
ncbi:MAG: RlmE family RNA methyltransferase [Promethearchaeota archaeon]